MRVKTRSRCRRHPLTHNGIELLCTLLIQSFDSNTGVTTANEDDEILDRRTIDLVPTDKDRPSHPGVRRRSGRGTSPQRPCRGGDEVGWCVSDGDACGVGWTGTQRLHPDRSDRAVGASGRIRGMVRDDRRGERLFASYVDESAAHTLYPNLDMITAGFQGPAGTLKVCDGGYRLSADGPLAA